MRTSRAIERRGSSLTIGEEKMKKSAVIGPSAIMVATTATAIVISTITPTDPHYGVWPKIMAAAFWSALGLIPAAIWIGIANFKHPLAKGLLLLQAIALLGFLTLNLGIGGFGFQALSFVFLAVCMVVGLPFILVLLYRGHCGSHGATAREPIQSPVPTRGNGT
ncbi:hypothetical protein ESB00_05715 [Oleiharenicola lentus]|uniref:Uncharacterized protein n=1 Tax=Oleiharenicola lentus TaxID=2508720 RepID=A0A4Q1C8V2_9BACT|nr:hypothetical protein [Oleiharenicola lentus]RXK55395.1 hypothetical protein ESB00_05715 [Oleiharenicola lentus]